MLRGAHCPSGGVVVATAGVWAIVCRMVRCSAQCRCAALAAASLGRVSIALARRAVRVAGSGGWMDARTMGEALQSVLADSVMAPIHRLGLGSYDLQVMPCLWFEPLRS
jgi:hypothetical protein